VTPRPAQPPPDPPNPGKPTSRVGDVEKTAATIALGAIMVVVLTLVRWALAWVVITVFGLTAIFALYTFSLFVEASVLPAVAAVLLLAVAWWQWRLWLHIRVLAGKYPFQLFGWHWFVFIAPLAALVLAVALGALQAVGGSVGLLAPLVLLSAAPWLLRRRRAA